MQAEEDNQQPASAPDDPSDDIDVPTPDHVDEGRSKQSQGDKDEGKARDESDPVQHGTESTTEEWFNVQGRATCCLRSDGIGHATAHVADVSRDERQNTWGQERDESGDQGE